MSMETSSCRFCNKNNCIFLWVKCDEDVTKFKSFSPLFVLHEKLLEFAMNVPGVSLITASTDKFQCEKRTDYHYFRQQNRVFRDGGSCFPLQ